MHTLLRRLNKEFRHDDSIELCETLVPIVIVCNLYSFNPSSNSLGFNAGAFLLYLIHKGWFLWSQSAKIMKFAIRLNKNLDCEYICNQIQKLIIDYQKSNNHNIADSVLSIDIIQLTDGGTNHIPKLEYKDSLT